MELSPLPVQQLVLLLILALLSMVPAVILDKQGKRAFWLPFTVILSFVFLIWATFGFRAAIWFLPFALLSVIWLKAKFLTGSSITAFRYVTKEYLPLVLMVFFFSETIRRFGLWGLIPAVFLVLLTEWIWRKLRKPSAST